MFTHGDNRNSSIEQIESMESIGEVEYDKMGMVIFFVPFYQLDRRPMMMTEELKSYIDVSYL
jgi:hypothetical protein